MTQNIPWQIIVKHLHQETTEEEQKLLDQWVKKSKQNLKIYKEIAEVYITTGETSLPLNPDKEKAWQKISSKISSGSVLKTIYKRYSVAAATVILLISISLLLLLEQRQRNWSSDQYTEIVVPMGQKSKVVLPDSSLVWLNSGSILKFRNSYNKKEREVELSGEGFFDVKKNKKKIFRVKTGILHVDVYGTAFNVKNYENDNLQEITVSEGSVGVFSSKNELKCLKVGQQAVLNKANNRISYTYDDPNVVSSWKNNELTFDNTPCDDVVKYLERWYGVSIEVDPGMKGKHNYTFKIKTESFTEMLEKMKLITPIEYEINGKDVRIRYTN